MRVEFVHTDQAFERWQPGEALTLEIVEVRPDGSYAAETVETFPADLRQRHATEMADLQATHAEEVARIRAGHLSEVAGLQADLERARKVE